MTYKTECTDKHEMECKPVYKTTYEKRKQCKTTYKEECKPSYNYEKKCTKTPQVRKFDFCYYHFNKKVNLIDYLSDTVPKYE